MPISTGVELTDEQEAIATNTLSWLYSRKSGTRVLAGCAGTGKTTLVAELLSRLPQEILQATAVVTYTGKASQVLGAKLFGANPGYIGTIHSLFYTPTGVDDMNQVVFELKQHSPDDTVQDVSTAKYRFPAVNFRLNFGNGLFKNCRISFIIVDELSMIDKNIYSDLTRLGLPILFCGDVEQLPPVNGLTAKRLLDPDYTLTEVHRQALDNGIIRVATNVRHGKGLPRRNEGREVMRTDRLAVAPWVEKFVDKFYRKKEGTGVMLCGRNDKRNFMNRSIREKLGCSSPYPEKGELVICLRNNKNDSLYNGTMCEVIEELTPHTLEVDHEEWDVSPLDRNAIKALQKLGVDPRTGTMKVAPVGEDRIIKVTCLLHTFGNQMPSRALQVIQSEKHLHLFDFGYCLTVHKSQGSEWDVVLFYTSRMGMQTDEEYRKWLYTGVTRASKKLMLVA